MQSNREERQPTKGRWKIIKPADLPVSLGAGKKYDGWVCRMEMCGVAFIWRQQTEGSGCEYQILADARFDGKWLAWITAALREVSMVSGRQ